MREPTDPPGGNSRDEPLRGLCRVGGVASWLLFVYCLATMV